MGTIRRPLDALSINSALSDGYWRVSVVDVTGSTQNDLVTLVRSGISRVGDVIVADFQREGRGRLDRSFVTPPQSALLFSFFIKPLRNSADWGWLPLLAGQAVSAAIDSRCTAQLPAKLKWPNDILINEKKVAGILSERVESPDGAGVIVGIGINVDLREEELPISTASSLYLQGCTECNREQLLVDVLQIFSEYLKRWESMDEELIHEYETRCATLGRRVLIDSPGGRIWESTAKGIDPSGALILATGEFVMVGDVEHLRVN